MVEADQAPLEYGVPGKGGGIFFKFLHARPVTVIQGGAGGLAAGLG